MQKLVIGIVLPKKESDFVSGIVGEIYKKTGCESAKYFPPHITFFYDVQEDTDKLEEMVKNAIRGQTSFTLETSGVSYFDNDAWSSNPYVVYVKLTKVLELTEIRKKIFGALRKANVKFRTHEEFIPHITLAHDDVKESDFDKVYSIANGMYSGFSFKVNEIVILRQLENETWIVDRRIRLGI